MSEIEAAALDYAARGLRVLPIVSAAKRPLCARGVKDATCDERQIRAWWSKWPDANVAIATGDGLAVVDVDPRNGGDETLIALVAVDNEGEAIDTPEVATGGNGRHYYFRARGAVRSRVLGAGVDLKAEGGYVVAPPSQHESGRFYVWHPARQLGDVPLVNVPEWATLDKSGRLNGTAAAPDEWVRIVRHGAKHGERNVTTARLAGHLLTRRSLDTHVALALIETWDQVRNRPPLGATEVGKIVHSIALREARKLEGGAT